MDFSNEVKTPLLERFFGGDGFKGHGQQFSLAFKNLAFVARHGKLFNICKKSGPVETSPQDFVCYGLLVEMSSTITCMEFFHDVVSFMHG